MRHIGKLLNPKIDYVFKRIFGQPGNENITASLVGAILNKEVTDLKVDYNTILEKDILDDKVGILDIKAKIDNCVNCDIELQVVDRKNIKKRILFYWSKMYTKSLKSGQDYSKLEKAIVILISNYKIEGLEEIKKYISKWNIREEENTQIILTNVMDIYIIELPKFKKYQAKEQNAILNTWVKFIESPEVIDVGEMNNEVKKAKEILEEISSDEREQYLAELREKYILDQNDIKAQGFEEGLKEGKKENSISIAKKMKEENIDINIISKVTGLTVEEIDRLN